MTFTLGANSASEFFIKRHDILAKYNYSSNDMMLLHKFIFADSSLMNIDRIKQLLTHFTFIDRVTNNVLLVNIAVNSLLSPLYVSLCIIIVANFINMTKRNNVLISCVIFLTAICVLAILGRPAVFRVQYPVVEALVIMSFIYVDKQRYYLRDLILYGIISIVVLFNVCVVSDINKKVYDKSVLAYQDYNQMSSSMIYYVRGGDLPYELIYLPFRSVDKDKIFYGLITSYYLPGTFSNEFKSSSNGFESVFSTGKTIKLISSKQSFEYIDKYCLEHYDKKLHVTLENQFNSFTIYTVKCN